eukprot:gene3580-4096_t
MFNLETVIGARTDDMTLHLNRLCNITKKVQEVTSVDWIVYYLGSLVKLAYQGEHSRPLFPLTADFEAMSNNSWVGIHGKGKLIQSLQNYDGPYYNCSDKGKAYPI